MRSCQLIKRNPKEHTVKEDNLSEPINTFVKSSVILKLGNFPESFLLDDDAIHIDFKSVEDVADSDEEEKGTTVGLAIDVLKPLSDVVVDWTQQVADQRDRCFAHGNRHD
jgi:hypothetical protein